MSSYELLDLVMSLSTRIDTHWTLFISVHLALIGGLIYVDRPLSKNEKLPAIFIYTGFAVINYLMMRGQIQFLASVLEQIVAIKDEPCCQNSSVIAHVDALVKQGNHSKSLLSINIVHVFMYIILVMSIVIDKKKSKL